MNERAVLYGRVSTEEENQISALKTQVSEGIECIRKNGWIHTDSYIDEGKSGTTTKRRNEYNRLFADMERDLFDIIVIKSEDRLMRNTKDWYLFIDRLVITGKKLYFYLDQKFYTPDDALITGIRAILAEEHSKILSKKQNNAHKTRQTRGTNAVITSKTWGYDKINKEVVINEKEAEMVRLIFELAKEGYGSRTISKMLTDQGYKSRTGNDIREGVIRKLLRNPLYKGTAVMNKLHFNFETKRVMRNPKSEWIYHEDIVPPIISAKLWDEVQKKLDKRTCMTEKGAIGKRPGSTLLSGKIICGECGNVYWRTTRRTKYVKRENKTIAKWSCSEYLQRGRKTEKLKKQDKIYKAAGEGCDSMHLDEELLMEELRTITGHLFDKDKKELLDTVVDVIKKSLADNPYLSMTAKLEKEITELEKQRELLLEKLLAGVVSDRLYKKKNDELDGKRKECEAELARFKSDADTAGTTEERLLHIKKMLEDEVSKQALTDMVIECIDKMIIYKDKIEIILDRVPETGDPLAYTGFKKRICLGGLEHGKNNYAETGIIKDEETGVGFSVSAPSQIPEYHK